MKTFAFWAGICCNLNEMTRRWLLLLATAVACAAQTQAPGPAVGTRVPTFQLTDQDGQSRSLLSLYGPKGLMLVFFRSADW